MLLPRGPLTSINTSFSYLFISKEPGNHCRGFVALIAAGVVVRYHKAKISPTIGFLMIVPAAILVLFNIAIELPYWGNEYKYLMVSAICLNPFAALATEYLTSGSVFKKSTVLMVVTMVLSLPFAYKLLMPTTHGGRSYAATRPIFYSSLP